MQKEWLADFTMVMTTRNRPRMLRDTVELYRTWPFEFAISIHDSSDPEIAAENRAFAMSHAPAVEYVEYPVGTMQEKKLSTAAAGVTTDFVICASEDDILVPQGLRAAIDFLRTN